jgi:hypothetical protein
VEKRHARKCTRTGCACGQRTPSTSPFYLILNFVPRAPLKLVLKGPLKQCFNMKNTIESNGGSELNDSRQAIQIVQRGRVRHKQAHVPCEISLTKKKQGCQHRSTSRGHHGHSWNRASRNMTRKHRRKQSRRIPRLSVRGTELFRQEDMRAIVMPTRAAALPRIGLGSGSDSAPSVPRLGGHQHAS